jgi:polyisoprenoid-binding protein YceI
MKFSLAFAAPLVIAFSAAIGAPAKYVIDPSHTYPSFTADHMGGLSTWRGKFNATSGAIVLDRQAQTGSLDVAIDVSSIDFGHEKMNAHAKSPDMFDAAKHPTAIYTGKLVDFKDGAPTAVEGSLTLHGVTKPVRLTIDSFLCKPHPMSKKEVCGANASGKINREDFGVGYGKQYGFHMNVGLEIQVEALKAD